LRRLKRQDSAIRQSDTHKHIAKAFVGPCVDNGVDFVRFNKEVRAKYERWRQRWVERNDEPHMGGQKQSIWDVTIIGLFLAHLKIETDTLYAAGTASTAALRFDGVAPAAAGTTAAGACQVLFGVCTRTTTSWPNGSSKKYKPVCEGHEKKMHKKLMKH